MFVNEIGLEAVSRVNRNLLGWRQEVFSYKFHVQVKYCIMYSGIYRCVFDDYEFSET
jgi:hypothetical protein